MAPVQFEPAAPRSRVKHSTTEPLCSQIVDVNVWSCTDACARMRACVCGDSSGLLRDVFIPLLTVNTEEKHYVNNLPE